LPTLTLEASKCSTALASPRTANHVYRHDRPISDDPTPFELLDGGLAKDSHVV
jgi:hypothetical protein